MVPLNLYVLPKIYTNLNCNYCKYNFKDNNFKYIECLNLTKKFHCPMTSQKFNINDVNKNLLFEKYSLFFSEK